MALFIRLTSSSREITATLVSVISAELLSDPNLAFLLIVTGILAIYWELHAPGLIAPGVIGLALVASGLYGFYQIPLSGRGLGLLITAALLLAIELKYYTHMISGAAGTLLLAVGALTLVQGPRGVAPALAIPAAAALGVITLFLGSLAMRARGSKHPFGIDALIGEVGTARTPIDPHGTVFVHGEYWQAHTAQPIAAGTQVSVRHVEDLVLEVEACNQ